MPPSNEAAELLNQIYQHSIQNDKRYAPSQPSVQPAEADPEARAEATRDAANASAIRGLAFGLPLALVLWGLPMIAWLATGNPWLGALAAIVEFGLAAWAFWAKRSPAAGGSIR